MRVKLLEGGSIVREGVKKKNQVYVALKREVCVRTDLVRSVTTDLTKQTARSGQTCCSDPAAFNRMIKKKKEEKTAVSLPLPLSPARFLSLLSASHHP